MKILVTGGSGLVGKYLQQTLDATYISTREFNLVNESEVARMFHIHNPDVVIHLAARVGGIMENIHNPYEFYEDNLLMNTFVVKWARLTGVKKFVGALSSCIFPDTAKRYPLLEEDLHKDLPAESNFGYGYAKRMLGVHIDIARKQGLNYSYVIPSNLYGEYEQKDVDKKHYVGALLEKIYLANKNNEDHITLFGDGTPLRQFTYAKDIAEILKMIVENDVRENLNISVPDNLTIDEMARLALKATNSEHLSIKYDTSKPNGQFRKDISIEKFQKIFPSFKFTPYIQGIEQTYKTLYGK